MSEEAEWTEVKPRHPRTPKSGTAQEGSGSPRSPKSRTQSFGDMVGEVAGRNRVGRTARREGKLEWSASKKRERDVRIEKRMTQKQSAAASREATPPLE